MAQNLSQMNDTVSHHVDLWRVDYSSARDAKHKKRKGNSTNPNNSSSPLFSVTRFTRLKASLNTQDSKSADGGSDSLMKNVWS